MAFKLIAFAAFVAVANAGVLPSAGPVSYVPVEHLSYSAPSAKAIDAEYDHYPQYNYAYDVHDTLTGDAKKQQESRNGDIVKGTYSLIEADGTRRTVDYTSDPVHGFNAVVHKEPVHTHSAPISKIAAPVAHAYTAPIAEIALPVAHAPALNYAHAPVTKYSIAPLASHVSYSDSDTSYVY